MSNATVASAEACYRVCRCSDWLRRAFCVVTILFSLLFVSVGGFALWDQHYKVATYRPVMGQLLSHEIRGVQEGYEYLVKYRYRIAGQDYTSENIYAMGPMVVSPDSQWWDRLRDGAPIPAFYNPDNPSEAFLTTKDIFPPCLFLLIGTGTAVFGLGIFGVIMSPGGWERKRKSVLVAAALWHGVGIFTCGYYYAMVGLADLSARPGRMSIMLLYELLGLIPLMAGLPKRTGRLDGSVKAA